MNILRNHNKRIFNRVRVVQSQGCAHTAQRFSGSGSPCQVQHKCGSRNVNWLQLGAVAPCVHIAGHSLIFLLSVSAPPSAGSATPGSPLYSDVVRGSEEPQEAPGSPASSCPLCRRRNWSQVCLCHAVRSRGFFFKVMLPGGGRHVAIGTLA